MMPMVNKNNKMAYQRGMATADVVKEPHSISLKVLRLSRPSLSIQQPLPTPLPSPPNPPKSIEPFQVASLAYPSTADVETNSNNFVLSPLLTLPPAFGSAYVGETFSCTLCANNELLLDAQPSKHISNVRIEAEMKIPSSPTPILLELGPKPRPIPDEGNVEGVKEKGAGDDLQPGNSLQKIVNFDLKEEGSHVLAVTVTYSETTPTSGRVRTFRKLYQFVCKGCLVVRTKSAELPSSVSVKGKEDLKRRKWALEAQLENCGEDTITLDSVFLETREGVRSTGLNWEILVEGQQTERPVLNTGDVQQICFLVEEVGDPEVVVVDGKLIFGVLSLSWRGPMGNRGSLTTGSLGTKAKV